MSWIDDLSASMLTPLKRFFDYVTSNTLEAIVEGADEAVAVLGITEWLRSALPDEVPRGVWEPEDTHPLHDQENLWMLIGAVMFAMERGTAEYEAELQQEKHESVRGRAVYPPDPSEFAQLAAHRPDARRYYQLLCENTGMFKEHAAITEEVARESLSPREVAEVYRRGILPEEKLDKLLEEAGYMGRRWHYSDGTDAREQGWYPLTSEQSDRELLKKTLYAHPPVQELIQMEVRDALPLPPEKMPEDIQDLIDQGDTEAARWADEFPDQLDIDEWEPGGGTGIREALEQPSGAGPEKYGPQSFASYFLGARQQYSETFEKAVQAAGYPPYWAMRTWEAHWEIPGWRMARRLLWRSPKVTGEYFKQMLRWQDYPPELLDAMVDASYRPLTRTDARRMYRLGMMEIPEITRQFLDYGYHIDNALRMTAFTVVQENERVHDSLVGSIQDAYVDGLLTRDQAVERLVEAVMPPEELPFEPEDIDYLRTEHVQRLTEEWPRMRDQVRQYWARQMSFAQHEREIQDHEQRLETAEQMYTSWEWTRSQTYQWLTQRGYADQRVRTLLDRWEPDREKAERHPTRSMLEDWLRENSITQSTFFQQMQDLGYAHETITAIMENAHRPLTMVAVEDLYTTDAIDLDSARDYLSRAGYEGRQIRDLLRMWEEKK